jgi:hypothetical protein
MQILALSRSLCIACIRFVFEREKNYFGFMNIKMTLFCKSQLNLQIYKQRKKKLLVRLDKCTWRLTCPITKWTGHGQTLMLSSGNKHKIKINDMTGVNL